MMPLMALVTDINRGVRGVVHVADHVEADHHARANTMKWPRNGSGDTDDSKRNNAAATPMSPSLRLSDIGFLAGGGSGGGAGAAAAGAADTCTAGGGHRTSPSRATVTPR